MICWLSQQEKVATFECGHLTTEEKGSREKSRIFLAKKPTSPDRPISLIQKEHSCPSLTSALTEFHQRVTGNPHRSLGFTTLSVYQQFKLNPQRIQDDDDDSLYVIKAHPKTQYDTVIVLDRDEAEATGLQGKEFII